MAIFSPTRTLTLPDVPIVNPSLSIRRQYSMISSRCFCMSIGVSVPGLTRACPYPDADTGARACASCDTLHTRLEGVSSGRWDPAHVGKERDSMVRSIEWLTDPSCLLYTSDAADEEDSVDL